MQKTVRKVAFDALFENFGDIFLVEEDLDVFGGREEELELFREQLGVGGYDPVAEGVDEIRGETDYYEQNPFVITIYVHEPGACSRHYIHYKVDRVKVLYRVVLVLQVVLLYGSSTVISGFFDRLGGIFSVV